MRARSSTGFGLALRLDRLGLRRADAVVIVAEGMRQMLPRAVCGGDRRCVFIPNGIETNLPESAPLPAPIAAFVARHRVNLVVVGRLSREKGLEDLVDAVADHRAQLENVGFTLLGEEPLRAALEGRIAAEGLQERFLLPGYLEQVAGYLGHFDALVLPSRTEGLPITVLEALRGGCPVIATTVGELPVLLRGCPSATLVPPHDPAQLASAIARYANTMPGSAAVAVSRGHFLARYAASTMAERYRDLYAEILGTN